MKTGRQTDRVLLQYIIQALLVPALGLELAGFDLSR